jgi:DNA polymerase-1
MNYIITKNKEYFEKIGEYNYCNLEDMILPETLALDTETTGLQPRNCDIFCVQIGTSTNNYIIHMYDDNYEFADLAPYLDKKILIGHNILFDIGFMYKYNFYPKQVLDTMLASKILYNGDFWNSRHDFGSVMTRELGLTYDKTDQKNIHLVKLSQQSTIKYSFNDVDRLIELHHVMLSKIDANGYRATYDLHCRYIRSLAYMEQCGLPLDPLKWKEKMDDDILNAAKGKDSIEEYIYDNIPKFADRQIDMFDSIKRIKVSINSPKQMLKVFEQLEIPTKDKDGKDSINENILSKTKHEFVPLWLKYQNANHRVTTFGQGIYDKIEDGRIYTNFNPMVDTARLSTRRGNINFLNFPSDKATRYCFKAKPGNVIIVCDYSGQETVVAADLSGDAAMTKSVVEGADLHCLLARVLFPEIQSLTDDEIVKDHKEKRNASKAPRFAMSYGGNAFTLHMNEGIPLKRAQEIETGFKDLHAGLYAWGDSVFKKSVETGYIESADGWKLKLPKFDIYLELEKEVKAITKLEWQMYSAGKKEWKASKEPLKKNEVPYVIKIQANVNIYNRHKMNVSGFFKLKSEYQRLCLNNPVQSRSAHQLKLATAMVFEAIEEKGLINIVKICNTIHDEIVLETPEEHAEWAKGMLEVCMLAGGNHYLTNLKIKADANTGQSWGEAK